MSLCKTKQKKDKLEASNEGASHVARVRLSFRVVCRVRQAHFKDPLRLQEVYVAIG